MCSTEISPSDEDSELLQRTGCRRGTRAMPPARELSADEAAPRTLLALCGPRSACSSRRYSPSWQSLAAICTHAVRMSACSNVAMVQSECCFEFQVCALQAMQGSAPPARSARGEVRAQRDDQEGPAQALAGSFWASAASNSLGAAAPEPRHRLHRKLRGSRARARWLCPAPGRPPSPLPP